MEEKNEMLDAKREAKSKLLYPDRPRAAAHTQQSERGCWGMAAIREGVLCMTKQESQKAINRTQRQC